MAKGFGASSPNASLGYILIVVPEDKIYACSAPFDEDDFGVTNSLYMAKVWHQKSSIEEYFGAYAEWVAETYYEGKTNEVFMQIAEIYKNKKGKLKAKVIDKVLMKSE